MEEWKARVYAAYAEVPAPGSGHPGNQARRRAADRRDYARRYGRFLPRDKTAPVLDIGCGTGGFVETLRSLGYTNVEGIDVSASQVEAATARGITGITLASAVDYLQGRAGRYTLITTFSVLEHQTRAELFELLDAIRSALRPGGTLMAVVPNAKGLFGAHVRFADITHESSFAPGSIIQICHVAGVQLVAILEHGPIVHGLASAVRWAVWQTIRAALLAARVAEGGDWRWPVFTQDLVFVARKPIDGDIA